MAIDKQTAKLGARILENLPADMDDDTMQGWIDNPKGLQKFLRGLCPSPIVVPESAPEPPLDFFTRVDRSVRPTYPDWVKKVLHQDLELTGPAEYDLQTQVEEWRHDDQKTGVVLGQVIYNHLKASNELAGQLGLADLLAIQAKGIKVFRALYNGEAVFGWKSVVQSRDIFGDWVVPYLYVLGGEVVLDWSWLDDSWDSVNPALRFRK